MHTRFSLFLLLSYCKIEDQTCAYHFQWSVHCQPPLETVSNLEQVDWSRFYQWLIRGRHIVVKTNWIAPWPIREPIKKQQKFKFSPKCWTLYTPFWPNSFKNPKIKLGNVLTYWLRIWKVGLWWPFFLCMSQLVGFFPRLFHWDWIGAKSEFPTQLFNQRQMTVWPPTY